MYTKINTGYSREITLIVDADGGGHITVRNSFSGQSIPSYLPPESMVALRAALRAETAQAPAPKTKPNMTPQAELVLKHLQQKGSITNVEANAVHKVRALPRRIADLKANGYNIRREFNTDLTGQRYVRYSLVA